MSSDVQPFTVSAWGFARNVVVDTFMYPFEVVKIHQQKPGNQERSYQIAQRLFQEGKLPIFYRGFGQEIGKTALKAFVWPVVIEVPYFLHRFQMGSLFEQVITGFVISTTSAFVSTPLENRRILSITQEQTKHRNYQGFFTHWAKLSSAWVVFLSAQQELRSRYLVYTRQDQLTIPQLATVGTGVALLVSLASAPFDVANTQKMGHNNKGISWSKTPRQWFRGLPLSAFIRVTNSIASVVLIDLLSRR